MGPALSWGRAMTPVPRPACPVCYRAGVIPCPFTDASLPCPHCDGTGFEPYWMGPDLQDDAPCSTC